MAKTYDLTKGNVTSVILKFYFPMLLTNMLQQLYTLADTAIVGKGLGDNALAAVGNMSSLTFLVIGFSMGLSNGFSVSIAQSFGAKDYNKMRRATAASIKLAAVITVVLTILSLASLKGVLNILRTDSAIMNDSLKYGYVIFGGLVTTIAYNLCACVLRALGDSKTPFIAIIISAITNVVLNYICIYILGTGVEGAAAATVISQVLSTAICLVKLRRIDILKLSRTDFEGCRNMYPELFRNGLPMALMNSITAVGCMVVQYFVNGLGVAYTSAFSPCSRYLNLFMQPACTAGFAMSSFTSQNFGAKKFERIRSGLHVCVSIALVTYFTLGSVMFFFPEWLAGLMLNSSETISLAAEYLKICGMMVFAVDLLFVFRSGCQGMGRPFIPMISGIIEMIMRISIIVIFIGRFGFAAAAWADVAAWLGALALNLVAFEIILKRYSHCGQKSLPKAEPALS